MKILFVGDDWIGSNAHSLANGFRQAGHEVVVIDTTEVTLPPRFSPSWFYAKAATGRAPWNVERVHRTIETTATDFKPDMLLAYKTIHLDQERLLGTQAALHVHYSADDVSNPYNTTPTYLAHESRWDRIITTKRHNVAEIRSRGGSPKFVLSAYDPAWHHLTARRTSEYYEVGFIGACRADRKDEMVRLARRHGRSMCVRGPGWYRVPELKTTGATVAGAVYGEKLSESIAGIRANLVFLNSDNRDTHTCRTFEVPAAGGLFVGERTEEHAELLDDGSEAFLFSDTDELDAILDRLKEAPVEADAVAAAGWRRISDGGHRYVDRAIEIVESLS